MGKTKQQNGHTPDEMPALQVNKDGTLMENAATLARDLGLQLLAHVLVTVGAGCHVKEKARKITGFSGKDDAMVVFESDQQSKATLSRLSPVDLQKARKEEEETKKAERGVKKQSKDQFQMAELAPDTTGEAMPWADLPQSADDGFAQDILRLTFFQLVMRCNLNAENLCLQTGTDGRQLSLNNGVKDMALKHFP